MAIRKKSGLVPPTLHYCGHNAKKIGPKKSLLKICTLHTLIRCTKAVQLDLLQVQEHIDKLLPVIREHRSEAGEHFRIKVFDKVNLLAQKPNIDLSVLRQCGRQTHRNNFQMCEIEKYFHVAV